MVKRLMVALMVVGMMSSSLSLEAMWGRRADGHRTKATEKDAVSAVRDLETAFTNLNVGDDEEELDGAKAGENLQAASNVFGLIIKMFPVAELAQFGSEEHPFDRDAFLALADATATEAGKNDESDEYGTARKAQWNKTKAAIKEWNDRGTTQKIFAAIHVKSAKPSSPWFTRRDVITTALAGMLVAVLQNPHAVGCMMQSWGLPGMAHQPCCNKML